MDGWSVQVKIQKLFRAEDFKLFYFFPKGSVT